MPVDAYRRDTGEKVRIPESYFRIFPDTFSKTPRQKAADRAAAQTKPKTSAAAENDTKEA